MKGGCPIGPSCTGGMAVRSKNSDCVLSPAEDRYFRLCLSKTLPYSSGLELIHPGEPLARPFFLLSGWISQEIVLADGRKQILDFYLPGDLAGYCSRPNAIARASYVALTPVTVANAAAMATASTERFPALRRLCRRYEDEAELRLFRQIVRNGRLAAQERLASLLLELYERQAASGEAGDGRFSVPLTQETIAYALGLSTVHLNRSLQQLRRDGVLRSDGFDVQILDWQRLEQLAALPGAIEFRARNFRAGRLLARPDGQVAPGGQSPGHLPVNVP